jgi:hypothetical protein
MLLNMPTNLAPLLRLEEVRFYHRQRMNYGLQRRSGLTHELIFRFLGSTEKERLTYFKHLRYRVATFKKTYNTYFSWYKYGISFELSFNPSLNAGGRKADPSRWTPEMAFDLLRELSEFSREQNWRVQTVKGLELVSQLAALAKMNPRFTGASSATLTRKLKDPTYRLFYPYLREYWETYLPFFLADSPQANGIERPELIEEVLVERPLLELQVLSNFLAWHPGETMALNLADKHLIAVCQPEELREAAFNLQHAGWLSEVQTTGDPARWTAQRGRFLAEVNRYRLPTF